MNLTNFLKQTDALTAQYSTEQLIAFIHEIGRIYPAQHREDFLEILQSVGNKTGKAPDKNLAKDIDFESDFYEMYRRVRHNLKRIDSQEITITGNLSGGYDDWYYDRDDDREEELYYKDNDGILEMMKESCDFVQICMDRKRYKEGFEVGRQLLAMEILCKDESGDIELSMEDMVYRRLLRCNLKKVILDTLYCAYHAVPSAKRPKVLYDMIANAKMETVTLESIMQHGNKELPVLEEFLSGLTSYLGDKTGETADRIVAEAFCLLNDISIKVQYAGIYAAVHPGLYLNILENGKNMPAKDMISIGIKAIKLIPKKYIMRSRAALKTAEYIIAAKGELSLLEKCYFVAYESDTSALNYLRALLNGFGSEKRREMLRKIFMRISGDKGDNFYACAEREENRPDSNMIFLLRFLDGQFADVLDKGLNRAQALGWTGTFMKQGIALYLLYLYEGQWNGQGIAAMAELVKSAMQFSAEAYREGVRGLEELEEIEENDLFCRVFLKWKSGVQMESDIRDRAVKKITALLEKRVVAIMDANRFKYYGECAAYLAALGEVRESMGELGAKQRLMTFYKDRYSRRNTFLEEMIHYGWKACRKTGARDL